MQAAFEPFWAFKSSLHIQRHTGQGRLKPAKATPIPAPRWTSLPLRQSRQPHQQHWPQKRHDPLPLRPPRPYPRSRIRTQKYSTEVCLRPRRQYTGRSDPKRPRRRPIPPRRQQNRRIQRHRIHLRRPRQPDLPPAAWRRKPILPIRFRKPTRPRRNQKARRQYRNLDIRLRPVRAKTE